LIPGVFNTWAGNVASHSQAVSVALRYDFAEQAAHPSIITKAK
jgi:hypothetical protein